MNGTVLLVDDQATQRLIATTVLEPMVQAAGVQLREAASAKSALEILDGLPTGERVLLLTDAVMPMVGGLELIQEVRARHPERPVRFVLLTAHDGGTFDGVKAELGIDAVVTKPVGIDSLRAALRGQLDDWLGSIRMD